MGMPTRRMLVGAMIETARRLHVAPATLDAALTRAAEARATLYAPMGEAGETVGMTSNDLFQSVIWGPR
jgi:hypothetical protein